jgi:hypothetical protein
MLHVVSHIICTFRKGPNELRVIETGKNTGTNLNIPLPSCAEHVVWTAPDTIGNCTTVSIDKRVFNFYGTVNQYSDRKFSLLSLET